MDLFEAFDRGDGKFGGGDTDNGTVLFVEVIYEVNSLAREHGDFKGNVGEKGRNGPWDGAERGGKGVVKSLEYLF